MAEMTEESKEVTDIDKLIMMEYRVEQSQVVDGVPIWFIEGFGMSTYVRDDDTEALAALADEKAHDERVKQADESPDQTMIRWHDDPDNEFELPADQEKQVRERVEAMTTNEEE